MKEETKKITVDADYLKAIHSRLERSLIGLEEVDCGDEVQTLKLFEEFEFLRGTADLLKAIIPEEEKTKNE